MYKKVDTSLNFVDREKEVIDFWKKNNVFAESIERARAERNFPSTTAPPRLTASLISVTS